MVATRTQQEVENFLRGFGFTGPAVGGRAEAFTKTNPAIRSAYERFTSTPTPAAPTYDNGAMPINVVPMNPWEQTALQRAATGVSPATVERDPFAQKLLEQAGGVATQAADFITQGAAPLSEADITKFQNPYQQQVVDASMTGLSRQAEEMRAQLLKNAGQRGAAGFGSTVTALPMANLNRDTLEAGAKLQSGLNYQGYNDAVTNALRERALMSSGGTGLTNLTSALTGGAGTAQNIGANAVAQEAANINAQLGAGETLRNYQQGVSDIAFSDFLAQQGYPMQQAQNTQSLLAGLQSGLTTQPAYVPSNTASTLGGLAKGADVLGRFL